MTVQFDQAHRDYAQASAPSGRVMFSKRPGLYRNYGKRVLDVAVCLLLLPVAVPLIALLAIAVALDGGVPIYRSLRVGRGGRTFGMWKLRSMVPDADAILRAHLERDAEASREWAITQKLKNDPRITPLGRVLRKTSLDELPQIFNVLTGDMSLVGPRPMLPEQREIYPGLAYYDLRPGMTGPWQISARNECSFQARAEYDRTYDKELSLKTDIAILVRTVGVVTRGTGY